MAIIDDRQLYATDDLIQRNRTGRMVILVLWIAFLVFTPPYFGGKIATDWWGPGIWVLFGTFAGVIGSIVVFFASLSRFIVDVDALHAFVTIDQFRTFFGEKSGIDDSYDVLEDRDQKVYVIYGPGLHVSYPWESREEDSNVSLEEASEEFSFEVQCKDGIITGKGSLRMRPDIRRIIPFLSGVASIASDVVDLVKAFIVEELADEEVMDALKKLPELNQEVNKSFGLAARVDENGNIVQSTREEDRRAAEANKDDRASNFERRFGVNVGDVPIAELLPSQDVRDTLSGLTEAKVIADGAAIILGYQDGKAARKAVTDGEISQQDLNVARDRFMAASKNLAMKLDANEYTFKLEGLDPDLVKALTALGPALSELARSRKSS